MVEENGERKMVEEKWWKKNGGRKTVEKNGGKKMVEEKWCKKNGGRKMVEEKWCKKKKQTTSKKEKNHTGGELRQKTKEKNIETQFTSPASVIAVKVFITWGLFRKVSWHKTKERRQYFMEQPQEKMSIVLSQNTRE